jgi:hypothetical protein
VKPIGHDFSDAVERFHDLVQSWSAPVWFNRDLAAAPETVDDNGSCGFVANGTHRFLVTAWHVLDGFRSYKRSHPSAVFAVNVGDGNTVALHKPTVIAEAADLDFATIAFPDLDFRQPHTKRYFPLDRWPAIRPCVGEIVTIIGFSGQGRRAFETFGAFEPFVIGMSITGVSDRRIVLADQNGSVPFNRDGHQVEEGMALGGFSGSMAFVLRPDSVKFVGIVISGSTRLGLKGCPGTILLAPADYLMADGRLDELRMPWRAS